MANCKCDKIVGKWVSLCCGSGCWGEDNGGGGDGTFQVNCKKVIVESSGDFEAELVQGDTFADYLKVTSDGSPITFNLSLENNNPPSVADFEAYHNGNPIPWYDSEAEEISSLVFHLGHTFEQWGKFVGNTQTLELGDVKLEFYWEDLDHEVEVKIKVTSTGGAEEYYDAWIHKESGTDVKLIVTPTTLWKFATSGGEGEGYAIDPLTKDNSWGAEIVLIQLVVRGYTEFYTDTEIPLGSSIEVSYDAGEIEYDISYHSSSNGRLDTINEEIFSSVLQFTLNNVFACESVVYSGQEV